MEIKKLIKLLLEFDNCSICSDPMAKNLIGFVVPCSHFFCLHCILKWANITLLCPLCKGEIQSIQCHIIYYKNQLLSNEYFKSTLSSSVERSRLHATNLSVGERSPHVVKKMPFLNTLQCRSKVYSAKLIPFKPEINTGVNNISSAVYYRENVEAYRRMSTWISRDLTVLNLFLNFENNENSMLNLVLSLLKQHDITSREFYKILKPHMGVYTKVFVNELDHFAISKLDMEDYDLKVKHVSSIIVINCRKEVTVKDCKLVIEYLTENDIVSPAATISLKRILGPNSSGVNLSETFPIQADCLRNLTPDNPNANSYVNLSTPVSGAFNIGKVRLNLFHHSFNRRARIFNRFGRNYESQVDDDNGPNNKRQRLSKGTNVDDTAGGSSSTSSRV